MMTVIKHLLWTILASMFCHLILNTRGINIHPAVWKNFVGPLRARQNMAVVKSLMPFDDLPLHSDDYETEQTVPEVVPQVPPQEKKLLNFVRPRTSALRTRKTSDGRKGCQRGSACRRNLDTSFNFLMKMMETGRR